MTDSRPFSGSSGGGAVCARCGKTCVGDVMSCPSCGAELGGATVLDNVHAIETVLFDARRARVTASQTDTAPDAAAFPSEPPIKPGMKAVSELPSFAEGLGSVREPTDGTNEFDPFGSDIRTYLAHRPHFDQPAPRPPGSASSDPPTACVRRLEGHIELPPGSMVDEYEIEHRLGRALKSSSRRALSPFRFGRFFFAW